MDTVNKFTVIGVRDVRPPGSPEPVWIVDMSTDGTGVPTHASGFPHCALGWRVAEYGIDPTDVDTLLDVVLHEPHMRVSHTDPTFLYNCDQDTARAAHLARVTDVKKTVSHLDPHGLLDRIRRAHDPNDPVIDRYREQVRRNRSDAGPRGHAHG